SWLTTNLTNKVRSKERTEKSEGEATAEPKKNPQKSRNFICRVRSERGEEKDMGQNFAGYQAFCSYISYCDRFFDLQLCWC
ncbi:MAG: hypothetical protein RMK89_03475, partial [Armatimonadota bacterium]|nr:hypothetical protein [Armatimonadota bacterium]MDW8142505.1 hypothetical protein [Armatimonadota bacterium]